MRTLHIVQGGIENGDKAWLEKAARSGVRAPRWIVPKSAKVGDEVVIFVRGFGFLATAKVCTGPKLHPSWDNRYAAGLSTIRLIDPAISLGSIRREVPGLRWTKYPRSITTPSQAIAERIRSLVKQRRETGLPRLDSTSLKEANLAELRRAALMSARSKVRARNAKAVRRARSLAIRLYVLNRASGQCEGCGVKAPFRRADGSLYLEPHHTTRLSDGGPDHPARVIGLCPNCHRRAHYSDDATTFNQRLKRKLRKLESGGSKGGNPST